ncbi:related to ATP-binding cassette protein (ABC) transporter [Ustilago trichophora]|uniref:Related to ATP-binding cassette protein (ABC) transporter n=1 Tax=Ustilago trichophora TaxID=86804 RepID=A0A5C3EBT1_9BASI|nr:related to ATP-binding cassette protein (ABC) transporter [Ustilago trichophora]
MTKDLESPASTGGGLVWQDIKVSVPVKRSLLSRFRQDSSDALSSKILLQGLSGTIAPGEMLAIMGPSGAGKSTLLDILSTRKAPSSGSITTTIGARDVKTISSYVEQSDSLLGVLTVRETIWYSAKLSLPPSTPTCDIDERTDLIISDLGLSGVAHQKIGTPIQRGISGGQKRRVSIGCSLVTLPKILFLDEPTSGLDTFTAHEVIAAIRSLAKRHNIAVLATIHSPNWEIFSSFDNTLLLSKGRTIYRGSTKGVASWFAALGHRCPEHTNPADFMIELVNDDFLDSARNVAMEKNEEQQVAVAVAAGGNSIAKGDTKAFADAWEKHVSTPVGAGTNIRTSSFSSSSSSAVPCNHIKEATTTVSDHRSTVDPSRSTDLASQYSRTVTLTRRNFLNYSRNLLAYGVRLGMYLGMGILLATVWVNLAQTDTRINDRLSVHFFSVAFLGFMAVAGIPSFLEERSVLLREAKNSLYGPLAFTLANTISTIPLLFLCSLLFSILAYWSIGLHPGADCFFRFLAFLYLGVLAAEFQALLIAAAIPIFVAALAVCAFLNGFWMCVQGYFIRAVNLPRFWYYWAHWIDYETYAFDILVKNDLKGLVFTCQGSVQEASCNCSFPSSLVQKGLCAVSGEDVLDALQINGISVGLYAGILVVIVVVYRILFYAVLRYQLK